MAGLYVAYDANGGDSEHATQAKDVAAQPIVDAGDVAAHPGVSEGGDDRQRVEAHAAQEVHKRQVDTQQLRTHHLTPASVRGDQDHPIAQTRQQNWDGRRRWGGGWK